MRQLLTWTVTGLAAGWFVLTVMRSRREFGVLGDLVMGCLGAIVGGWLFRRLGIVAPDHVGGQVVVALVGATALLASVRSLRSAMRATGVANVAATAVAATTGDLEERLKRLGAFERSIVQAWLSRQVRSRDPNLAFDEQSTFGQRVADKVAQVGGSWTFIGVFMTALVGLDGPEPGDGPAVRPLPVHPAEPAALVPRGPAGAGDHDEPEPPGAEGSLRRPDRLRGQRPRRDGDPVPAQEAGPAAGGGLAPAVRRDRAAAGRPWPPSSAGSTPSSRPIRPAERRRCRADRVRPTYSRGLAAGPDLASALAFELGATSPPQTIVRRKQRDSAWTCVGRGRPADDSGARRGRVQRRQAARTDDADPAAGGEPAAADRAGRRHARDQQAARHAAADADRPQRHLGSGRHAHLRVPDLGQRRVHDGRQPGGPRLPRGRHEDRRPRGQRHHQLHGRRGSPADHQALLAGAHDPGHDHLGVVGRAPASARS